jgi:hypothetical protein
VQGCNHKGRMVGPEPENVGSTQTFRGLKAENTYENDTGTGWLVAPQSGKKSACRGTKDREWWNNCRDEIYRGADKSSSNSRILTILQLNRRQGTRPRKAW